MHAVCAAQSHSSGLRSSVLPSCRKLSGSWPSPSPEFALRQRARIHLKSCLLLWGSGRSDDWRGYLGSPSLSSGGTILRAIPAPELPGRSAEAIVTAAPEFNFSLCPSCSPSPHRGYSRELGNLHLRECFPGKPVYDTW